MHFPPRPPYRPAPRRAPSLRAGAVLLALAALLPAAAGAAPPRPRAAAAERDDQAPDVVTYGRRDDVMRYADDVAARRGLDPAWTRAALAQARFQPQVARFIMPAPAGTAKNWAAYRARFVEPVRIRAGAAFWRDNEAWLRKAEADYGVPPEIVVGIVGVESIYGRQMGTFRVLDALATLAFDFPAGRRDRSAFFRDELETLLVLARGDGGTDPLALEGSYAGAFGMPQFMPSSFAKHAVDFDGDGRIDLRHERGRRDRQRRALPGRLRLAARHADALRRRRAGRQRRARAPAGARHPAQLHRRPARRARRARLDAAGRGHAGPLALVELQNGDAAPSYVAGTANFYAVTRYNWSSYYALAVIELGEAVARQR